MIATAQDLRVVLVGPRNPLNIGAAARAMKNFGLEDLFLVGPHEPVWQESRAAVQAQGLMRKARVVPALLDAVKDRTLVFGTSSIARRTPSLQVISLEAASDFLRQREGADRVAVVFGSEKRGLRNQDLEVCQAIIRIPTCRQCPSLNLGQAVAVCCYEMRRWVGAPKPVGREEFSHASLEEVSRLTGELERLMLLMPSKVARVEKARIRKLRETLMRWPVSSQDVTLLLGVFRDIAWQLRSGRSSDSPANKSG